MRSLSTILLVLSVALSLVVDQSCTVVRRVQRASDDHLAEETGSFLFGEISAAEDAAGSSSEMSVDALSSEDLFDFFSSSSDAHSDDSVETVEAPIETAESPVEDVEAPVEDAGQPAVDASKKDAGKDTIAKPDAPDATKDSGPIGPKCIDLDGDGYGKGCPGGSDCDDKNPNFHADCPDCSKGVHAGCPCVGADVSCFDGDPSIIGTGACVAGVQACKDGYWSACVGQMLPQAEICDYKDNDCDGETDEGMQLSPCGNCDMSCTIENQGPDFGKAFNPTKENSSGVGTNDKGYLILDSSKINLAFIWIANSGEYTVSKIDTKTGWELGRYKVCTDPSRTSVDLYGDVWVGCRGDGGVAKILIDKALCQDKNGNGVIDTSEDKNGDHKISPDEMVSGAITATSGDECVKVLVFPDGATIARALGVDKDNNVWVGFWSTGRLRKLAEHTGETLDTIDIGCPPYGLVIDGKGIIWAQGGACGKLVRVDPSSHDVQKIQVQNSPYGIGIDYKQRIWLGGSPAARYDPATGAWNNVGSSGSGIAGSTDGFVYFSNDGPQTITKINSDTLQIVGTIPSGGSPHGVAVDSDGFVWSVNLGGSTTGKLDPKTMKQIGVYPTGSSPYTYSDFTGYALNNFTAPQGHYKTIFGVSSYRTIWLSIDVDAELPKGAQLKLRFKVAPTVEQLGTVSWFGPYGPFPPEKFPYDVSKIDGLEGNYMLVEVTLISNDQKATPVVKSITVKYKANPM